MNDESGYAMAIVSYRGQDGSLQNVHRGNVRGNGGAQSTGVAKCWISDPATMMSGIPHSGHYVEPTIDEILNEVISEFRENTIFKGAKVRTTGSSGDKTLDPVMTNTEISQEIAEGDINSVGEIFSVKLERISHLAANPFRGMRNTAKTFKKNKHTLKSVIDWITEVNGGFWYFSIIDGNATLTYDPSAQHKLIDLPGEPSDHQQRCAGGNLTDFRK